MTLRTTRALGDHAVSDSSPAGRSDNASTAAVDDNAQFVRNESPVNAMFAARRSPSRFAAKKGTAISSRLPAAITARMKPTFESNSRTLIVDPPSRIIVGSAEPHAPDKLLTFTSDIFR